MKRFLLVPVLGAALLAGALLIPGGERGDPAGQGAFLAGADPGVAREVQLPPAPERPPLPPEVTPEALLDWLEGVARDLARSRWEPPEAPLPAAFAALGYDGYRGIEYREEEALWRGESPFEIQLFHPGYLFPDPVRVHQVRGGEVTTIGFSPELFRYEGAAAPPGGADAEGLEFAGLRIHYPVNDPVAKGEVAVFLGASYFRLLGRGHAHGLSARGIAVNTVGAEAEEFPAFREFWLFHPGDGAERMTFLALLDGPSVAGAYRFELAPGLPTVLEVDARLFARAGVERLGVAPLTSMFLFDPDGARAFDDLRPRVHDSDGLLMRTHAYEWVWRPLRNRPWLQTSQLRDREPLGFGLLQRARGFEEYLDLEARYHDRPSKWVEILEGDWGEGGVELVEIPADSEFHDNIVAYWAPDEPFRAGESRRYRYRVLAFDDRLPEEELGRAIRTRSGAAELPGVAEPAPPGHRRFIVDFEGAPATAEPHLEVSTGRYSDLRILPLPDGAGARVTFRFEADGDAPSDLRLFLLGPDRRESETWSYLWTADEPR